MLEIENLTVSYGHVRGIEGVSVRVAEGEFVSVIGPNGAGKTTLLRAISGSVNVVSGHVRLDGEDISALKPNEVARSGISHVPQGRDVFANLTVQENLALGAMGADDARARMDDIFDSFPLLADIRRQRGGTLSGGQQQALAIARGLMSRPRLLMLDEPSLGLAPSLVESMLETIAQLHKDRETAILLVEQQAAEALELSQRTYVLESGRVVLAGDSAELLESDDIRDAYLGAGL